MRLTADLVRLYFFNPKKEDNMIYTIIMMKLAVLVSFMGGLIWSIILLLEKFDGKELTYLAVATPFLIGLGITCLLSVIVFLLFGSMTRKISRGQF